MNVFGSAAKHARKITSSSSGQLPIIQYQTERGFQLNQPTPTGVSLLLNLFSTNGEFYELTSKVFGASDKGRSGEEGRRQYFYQNLPRTHKTETNSSELTSLGSIHGFFLTF